MSENIVHTSIYDDNHRLVETVGDRLPAVFATALRQCNDIARLGSVTRHADKHSVELLQRYRETWRRGDGEVDPVTLGKLAFVIGWLSHRAADRQLKPVFRETTPNKTVSPTDCSIYHDAFIYQRRYTGGEAPYSDLMFQRMASGPEGQAVDGLRELVRSLMQGTLIALHTFIPDDDACDAWLDKLMTRFQRWRIDMDRYQEAVMQPDPDKQRRYVVETNFYDPEDSLIALCERLQAGESVSPAEVEAAAARPQASHYGQALAKAWGFVLAAGDYFHGRIDEPELAAALEHGQAGRDGKAV